MDWMDKLLYPLQWVVAWILAIFHEIFTAIGMAPDNGWTWVLSIAGLTLVIRALLIPLFVYQIKSQRKMQLLQPQIQRLQAKYKGKKDQYSRQAMAEEQMTLFRENKTSPWASCLPLLVQMPIFFSLFRVIRNMPDVASGKVGAIGGFTRQLAEQAESSSVLGVSLSAVFTDPGIGTKILTGILIVIMASTMFVTQKQMMAKNMSETAMANPMMQSQKMLLYVMPLVFGFGGLYFPLGVLFYWLVSNTWTMAQQHVVIRNMPAPGSKAEKEMLERKARKGKPEQQPEITGGKDAAGEDDAPSPSRQRQQPVSKNRKKNKKR